jgi:DNA-directed RNA polymerase sigma subunit (sigma70/sigma32)
VSELLSLDAPLRFWSRSGGEDGPALYDFLNVAAPEARPDVTGLREGLVELFSGLSPDEQLIVAAWFGLADGRERALTEIAEILTLTGNPISPQDVYAGLQTALQKLRTPNVTAALAAIAGEPQ